MDRRRSTYSHAPLKEFGNTLDGEGEGRPTLNNPRSKEIYNTGWRGTTPFDYLLVYFEGTDRVRRFLRHIFSQDSG